METFEKKQFVEEFKAQWNSMWHNRVDDRVRAEGIADKDYSLLSVDRGTVIIATRKFKLMDFHETLQQHRLLTGGEIIPPNPSTGGWRKFSKTFFVKKAGFQGRAGGLERSEKKSTQPMKKGGRGWLHFRR